ncbi:hypothetical protein KR044_003138, partial [Drosophila immigrans]
MSKVTKATQTTKQDFLLAMQLRINELRSILQIDEESNSIPVENAETKNNQKPTPMLNAITFGSNNTAADQRKFETITWDCYSLATRALLDAVFDKRTLATCTLSGIKRGTKSAGQQLDPLKIQDIVELVQQKCEVSELCVKKIIVTKCSDTGRTKRFNRK